MCWLDHLLACLGNRLLPACSLASPVQPSPSALLCSPTASRSLLARFISFFLPSPFPLPSPRILRWSRMLLPSSIVLLLAAQVVHSAPRHLQEIIDALSEPVALRMPRTELPPARAVGFMERAWTLWQGKVSLHICETRGSEGRRRARELTTPSLPLDLPTRASPSTDPDRREILLVRQTGFLAGRWTCAADLVSEGKCLQAFLSLGDRQTATELTPPTSLPPPSPSPSSASLCFSLSLLLSQGSFGGDGGGGAHFYSTALREQTDGRELMSMLLSYEVAFSPGFDFHWGGKVRPDRHSLLF